MVAGRRRKVSARRKKSKGSAPMDWRLTDDEFAKLHQKLQFTMEACCDQRGLNGHQNLPYYSAENSILDNDVSGQCLFVNPPWKLAGKIIDHIRRCHAKNPENTKALIVLPKWPTFENCTKGLTLYNEIPARHVIFTRSPDFDGTIRENVSPVPWAVQYWLLDEHTTPVHLEDNNIPDPTPDEEANINLESTASEETEVIVEENREFSEAADRWLPKAAAYTIMDPDKPEPLMRLPISFAGCDTDALVDNAATLNFVSGEFVDRHDIKWRTAPKIAVRVANAQRIASTRTVVPDTLVINGINYSGIQFRVLSNLKAADVILGLPAQRSTKMTICPASDSVVIDGAVIPCLKQDRHVDCFLMDCKGIEKLLRKQSRKQTADFFLVDIKQVVDEALVTSDFGPEFDTKLRKLLDEYTDVSSVFTGLPPSRGIFDHKIQFTKEPRRQRRNRLSLPEFEELKRQCIEYFSQGRVRISNSPYAAPIIFVRKPDGSMRRCIDYRGANECTVRDSFPLPRIDELLERLRNAMVLTHLDLQQGYHQIRMDEESIPRTAFQGVTPSGAPCLLEFVVMSFGLMNAPATFSRLTNHVLEPYLNKFVLVYLDDICIYSSSLDEHLEHLTLVLELLRKHKLQIKLSKCTWAQKETEYLGVIAGNGCLRPSPDKLAAVQKWPLPKTQREVKSFVAFCSFYRKFVHHFSDCAAPLIDLYSGYTRRQKSGSVIWNDDARDIKARLVSAPVLLIPECGHESTFVVATDASDVGLGAVLLQEDHAGDLRPCAYYARKLNDAERKYSAYDKEALAVVEAVHRAWRVYLEGSKSFSVVTDHATLTHLLTQPSTNLTKRQAHFVEKLMPYAGYMRIVYRKGSANEADPVSRRPDFYSIWWDGEVPDLEFAQTIYALDAVSVSIDEAVCQQLKDGYAATEYFSENGRWRHDKLEKTADGLFLYHGRIVIPRSAQQLRALLLSEYHDSAGHPGWKRLMAILMKKYWWKGIMNDCKNYVGKCVVCNRAKPDRRGCAPVNPLPVPAYPWEVVGVDYITNLPKSGKHKYTAVMAVVCHQTRMAHFIPCTDEVTAEESADLFTHHVYRLHGVPRVSVSDRDPRFISAFWQALWRRLNTKLNMSTARRPQTDGLTERVNETMQSLLRCVCAEAGYDWASHLDMIEFAYNSFVGDAGKHSPFETYYGYQPPAPVDLMLPLDGIPAPAADRLQNIRDTQLIVKQLLQLSKEKQAAKGSASAMPVFEPGDYVKVSTHGLRLKSQSCRKLMDRYIGPFRVLERVGNLSYRLQLERGSRLHPVFHVDVLSKAASETPLRSRPVDAVDDDMEYRVDYISDVKLDNWPRRRGLQVLFLTHYVGYNDPEWTLLDLIDDCVALDEFLKSDEWASFAQTKAYSEFVLKYPRRAVRIYDEANVIYARLHATAYRPR